MKIAPLLHLLAILFLQLSLTPVASAGDSLSIVQIPVKQPVTVRKVEQCHIGGTEFETVRKRVEEVVGALGGQSSWSNFGPDSTYWSARINLHGRKYTINSWYPIFHLAQRTAVSEKYGLVSVSSEAEKKEIETQNSEKYRILVSIFELCPK